MPVYIQRTIQQFEYVFFACPLNPEGYTFQCVFCSKYFKTDSERKTHLIECAIEETGEDFYESYMLDDETSVSDALNDKHVYIETVKEFIKTNELRGFEFSDANIIKEYIKNKLVSNGFRDKLYNSIFKIYSFFFQVTEEEENEARNDWANYVFQKAKKIILKYQ